mgnify:CR=1 FL=1
MDKPSPNNPHVHDWLGTQSFEPKSFENPFDPKQILDGITNFYTVGMKEGVFAPGGGNADVVRSDLEFYTEAGQLQGPASGLKVEDFWSFGPLERARKALGG